MKKIILSICLLGISFSCCYSQKQNSNDHFYAVHLRPSSALSIHNPRIGVGIERQSSSPFVFGIDFGLGFDITRSGNNNSNTTSTDYFFWEIRPEVKHFINSNNKGYLSMEGFYTNYHRHKLNGFVLRPPNAGGDYGYTEADYNKTKIGLHFKFGRKHRIIEVFELDYFVGLGAAIRKATFENVIETEDFHIPKETFSAEIREQNGPNIHGTIGFKIGYLFGI